MLNKVIQEFLSRMTPHRSAFSTMQKFTGNFLLHPKYFILFWEILNGIWSFSSAGKIQKIKKTTFFRQVVHKMRMVFSVFFFVWVGIFFAWLGYFCFFFSSWKFLLIKSNWAFIFTISNLRLTFTYHFSHSFHFIFFLFQDHWLILLKTEPNISLQVREGCRKWELLENQNQDHESIRQIKNSMSQQQVTLNRSTVQLLTSSIENLIEQ